jgi:hypothetical protein
MSFIQSAKGPRLFDNNPIARVIDPEDYAQPLNACLHPEALVRLSLAHRMVMLSSLFNNHTAAVDEFGD